MPTPIAYVAAALIAAMVAQWLARKARVPTVTAYVIVGVVLGGSFLGEQSQLRQDFLFNADVLKDFSIVSELALGLIAFSIGAELELKRLRSLGKSIICITLLEACCAFAVVTLALGLWLGNGHWSQALVLGAIASATAPAATVSVIRQYKAKGPLTDTILAVVGIDDAVALIIYEFAAVFAHFTYGELHGPLWLMAILPFAEVAAALGVGALCGLIALPLLNRSKAPETLMFASVTAIVFTVAVATVITQSMAHFHCSPLLTVMAMSATLVNREPLLKQRVGQTIRSFVPIFFAFFFILGGAHLNVLALRAVGVVALIYLVARAAGKIGGASLGAWVGGAQPKVRRFIGYSLIPQVGVAVALAYAVELDFHEHKDLAMLAMNVLLFTTLITEIVGPLMTRYALVKSGEGRLEIDPA